MAASSKSNRRVAMLEDVDNLPKLSGKTVGELHEMELAFIQQRKDQPTCCTLDADVDVDTDVGVDMKSRTSSSLKEEMRASSPLNQALLSNCHSQSPDPVDSYWWKQENLLDSWVAPSFPSLSADVRDTSQPKNSRAQVAAEDGAASNKRTIIVAPNKRMVIASPNEEDDDLSPDVTILSSTSSQPVAHRVIGVQANEHHGQENSQWNERSNGEHLVADRRRVVNPEGDSRDQRPATSPDLFAFPSPSTNFSSASMQSVSSNNGNSAKRTMKTHPTREEPTLHAGWKIVENKKRVSLPPQRPTHFFFKDSSPAPESPNGAVAAWGATPPQPAKFGDAFISPFIGPQLPSGWGRPRGSYSTPPTTMTSRRSLDGGGGGPPMTSPFNLDERKRKLDNAMRDYEGLKYIDTHCHLDLMYNNMHKFEKYSAWRRMYSSTYPPTYEGCIPDWCDPTVYREGASDWWRTVMEDDPTIVGTAFGCHPHLANLYDDAVHQRILHLTKTIPKVVAVGECGFDFSHKNDKDKDVQQYAFSRQIEIAKETDKVLLIHCRGSHEYATDARGDAEDICFNCVKQGVVKEHRVHRHCFTYGWRVAERWLKEFPNLFIGLTPLIMNAAGERAKVNEVVKNAPIDRLLIETDSPYFMPHFYKSFGITKGGHPGGGINVALRIAEARGMKVEVVLEQLRENTRRCYGI